MHSSQWHEQVDGPRAGHGGEHEVLAPEAARHHARRDLQQHVAPEERRQDGVLSAALPFELLEQKLSHHNVYCYHELVSQRGSRVVGPPLIISVNAVD